MGKYRAYESYKNSGVEWLGEIPEHWENLKIKRLTPIKRGASPRPIDDTKYFDDEGEYAWVRIADVTASDRYLEITTQKLSELGKSFSVPLEPGELFLSIAGSVGKPIITKIKCCIHDGFVYFPDLKADEEFLYYIFSSGQPYLGLGKLGTQLNLNTETVGAINVGFPPLEEQKAIARFLDYKTKQIDALISKKEALLEKLDEKRTALISHAVTKGLDATVPMKDSDIEWLGEIPEHWKSGVKLLYMARDKQHSFVNGPFGSDLLTSEIQDSGIPAIYSGDVKPYAFFRKSDKYVSQEKAKQLNFCRVDPGDLLLAKVGDPPGDAAVYPYSEESGIVTQDVVRIKLDTKKAIPEYLSLFLNSKPGNYTVKLISVEATRSRFLLGDFKGIRLFISPIEEQIKIVNYGEALIVQIKQQKAKIQQAIDLLKEYRTALITNAVTGKIDVRQVSIPQS